MSGKVLWLWHYLVSRNGLSCGKVLAVHMRPMLESLKILDQQQARRWVIAYALIGLFTVSIHVLLGIYGMVFFASSILVFWILVSLSLVSARIYYAKPSVAGPWFMFFVGSNFLVLSVFYRTTRAYELINIPEYIFYIVAVGGYLCLALFFLGFAKSEKNVEKPKWLGLDAAIAAIAMAVLAWPIILEKAVNADVLLVEKLVLVVFLLVIFAFAAFCVFLIFGPEQPLNLPRSFVVIGFFSVIAAEVFLTGGTVGSFEHTKTAVLLFLLAVVVFPVGILHPQTFAKKEKKYISKNYTGIRGFLPSVAVAVPVILLLESNLTPKNILYRVILVSVLVVLVALRVFKTSRQQALDEQALMELSYTDELTGLANKREVKRVVAQKDNLDGAGFFFIDINDFKLINDGLGHLVGDAVICAVAEKLKISLYDIAGLDFVLSRVGGDEFVVVVFGSDQKTILNVANTLCKDIAVPLVVEGVGTMYLTAAVGVSFCEPGKAFEQTLEEADTAMYNAKKSGSAVSLRVYADSMSASAKTKQNLKDMLHAAVEKKEISLVYQPIHSISADKICGLEALARWEVDGTKIPPEQFIPLAEESGLIGAVGKSIISQAIEDICNWKKENLVSDGFYISINLSVKQLLDSSLVDYVESNLKMVGLDNSYVRFEVTETLLLGHAETDLEMLTRLRDRGFSVGLDDFGTGYSALSYLGEYPIDYLKLDKSFIQKSSGSGSALLAGVISFGLSLGVEVIVEGVETEKEIELLKGLGCDKVQGYFVGRPSRSDSVFKA